MKKLLTILIPVLVLIGLVAPKIVGVKLESALNNLITSVNKNQVYHIEVKKLKSGWFSTDVTVDITLDLAAFDGMQDTAELASFTVAVDVNANHGPVLFGENSGLGWFNWTTKITGEALREQLDWAKDTALYQVHGNMDMFGNYFYEDNIQAFSADITENNIKLAFDGYQGKGQYTGEQFTYHSSTANFSASSDLGEMKIQNLTVDLLIKSSLQQMLESGLYDSDSKINFAAINLVNKEKTEKVDISDFYVTVATLLSQDQQQINMQVAYGTKALDVNEFHAEDLALELALNNISNEFIKAYQGLAQSMSSTTPDEVAAKTLEFMQANLLLLLAAEPQINITSLRGTLAQGSFNSNLDTSLIGITALPAQLEDPAFWLSHALVNGQLSGDKAVIELIAIEIMKTQLQSNPQTQDMSDEEIEQIAAQQIPAVLQSLEQQGFIKTTDNSYSTSVTLKNGELKVNEKVIPLPF